MNREDAKVAKKTFLCVLCVFAVRYDFCDLHLLIEALEHDIAVYDLGEVGFD